MLDDVLSGIVDAPFPVSCRSRPPSTPSQLSTDDEYVPPSHPGVVSLFPPAEGITTRSLDPRRSDLLPRVEHDMDLAIPALNPSMPSGGPSLNVPPISTMEIEIPFDDGLMEQTPIEHAGGA